MVWGFETCLQSRKSAFTQRLKLVAGAGGKPCEFERSGGSGPSEAGLPAAAGGGGDRDGCERMGKAADSCVGGPALYEPGPCPFGLPWPREQRRWVPTTQAFIAEMGMLSCYHFAE